MTYTLYGKNTWSRREYRAIVKKGMMKEILKGLKPQLKMGKLTKQLLGELNDEKKHRFNQLRKSLIRLT